MDYTYRKSYCICNCARFLFINGPSPITAVLYFWDHILYFFTSNLHFFVVNDFVFFQVLSFCIFFSCLALSRSDWFIPAHAVSFVGINLHGFLYLLVFLFVLISLFLS